jgi:ATP-dependent RNA helicase SUPV3L1/SUV3
VPPLPPARRLAKPLEVDPVLPPSFYAAVGFRLLEGLALRADRLERLAAAARRLARRGPFAAGAEFAAIAGVESPALRRLLAGLGYRAEVDAGEETFIARPRHQREIDRSGRRRRPAGEGHPFAKLRELKLA